MQNSDQSSKSLEDRVRRVTREEIALVPYDPDWPARFQRIRQHLQSCLPRDLLTRIEHFGSTAVPGLAAKPIIDVLVGVTGLDEARRRVVPVLVSQGMEYFWRPTHGDDGPPWYAWFIQRDGSGNRTHHIHVVEPTFQEHWDRLLFRDYLIQHPQVAAEYERLKRELAAQHPRDRVAYTRRKTEFVMEVTRRAKQSRRS